VADFFDWLGGDEGDRPPKGKGRLPTDEELEAGWASAREADVGRRQTRARSGRAATRGREMEARESAEAERAAAEAEYARTKRTAAGAGEVGGGGDLAPVRGAATVLPGSHQAMAGFAQLKDWLFGPQKPEETLPREAMASPEFRAGTARPAPPGTPAKRVAPPGVIEEREAAGQPMLLPEERGMLAPTYEEDLAMARAGTEQLRGEAPLKFAGGAMAGGYGALRTMPLKYDPAYGAAHAGLEAGPEAAPGGALASWLGSKVTGAPQALGRSAERSRMAQRESAARAGGMVGEAGGAGTYELEESLQRAGKTMLERPQVGRMRIEPGTMREAPVRAPETTATMEDMPGRFGPLPARRGGGPPRLPTRAEEVAQLEERLRTQGLDPRAPIGIERQRGLHDTMPSGAPEGMVGRRPTVPQPAVRPRPEMRHPPYAPGPPGTLPGTGGVELGPRPPREATLPGYQREALPIEGAPPEPPIPLRYQEPMPPGATIPGYPERELGPAGSGELAPDILEVQSARMPGQPPPIPPERGYVPPTPTGRVIEAAPPGSEMVPDQPPRVTIEPPETKFQRAAAETGDFSMAIGPDQPKPFRRIFAPRARERGRRLDDRIKDSGQDIGRYYEDVSEAFQQAGAPLKVNRDSIVANYRRMMEENLGEYTDDVAKAARKKQAELETDFLSGTKDDILDMHRTQSRYAKAAYARATGKEGTPSAGASEASQMFARAIREEMMNTLSAAEARNPRALAGMVQQLEDLNAQHTELMNLITGSQSEVTKEMADRLGVGQVAMGHKMANTLGPAGYVVGAKLWGEATKARGVTPTYWHGMSAASKKGAAAVTGGFPIGGQELKFTPAEVIRQSRVAQIESTRRTDEAGSLGQDAVSWMARNAEKHLGDAYSDYLEAVANGDEGLWLFLHKDEPAVKKLHDAAQRATGGEQ